MCFLYSTQPARVVRYLRGTLSSDLVSVSIIIPTRNRADLLQECLHSVRRQTFRDFEVVIVNDGSTDTTREVIERFADQLNIHPITHATPRGVTASRQEALLCASGEFVATLDDDDEWCDVRKLEKQISYFRANPGAVLIGGARLLRDSRQQSQESLPIFSRPLDDATIRRTMLLRNNFFTSTVMFRRSTALAVGGFITQDGNIGEDYSLWLRLGARGGMRNFPEPLDIYNVPKYSREKFTAFLQAQLDLIDRHRKDYPHYWLARTILKLRIAFGSRARFEKKLCNGAGAEATEYESVSR